MSMFHELMMRKKEQIMYATIKGSLTESPEGVFSGFGSGNFLQIQNIINIGTKDFVIATKIKANSINNTRIIANYGTNYSGIHISSSKIAGSFYINGTRVQINSDITFTTNTDYYVIMYRKGTTIGIKTSTDNVNWTTNEQTIQSTDEVNFGFNNLDIGVNRYGATNFNGSIDLNSSYIKLGSTKYNLQAVVGYTVVGSPTITDGVVSGFSSANYLQVPTDFNNNNFEMILKLEDIGTQNLARTIMRLQNADITIGLTGSNQLSITGISDLSFSSGFNTSGILYAKFVQKGLDYSFGYSNDGITYTMLNKTLTQQISYVSPNRILQSGNWSGISVKLYVKDCRIWINNKLWFNGQQA